MPEVEWDNSIIGNFDPSKIVGRSKELGRLKEKVANIQAGKGQCVILLGEAGVGKTSLGLLTSEHAEKDLSFETLYGKCQDSQTPFMPWAEALKKIKLDYLVFSEPVSVEYVSVMDKNGLLMASTRTEETLLDDDILNSMMTAVKAYVSDSLDQMGLGSDGSQLNLLQQGDYSILLEAGEDATVMAICQGKIGPILKTELQQICGNIHTDHVELLKNWNGNTEDTKVLLPYIQNLIERHEGLGGALRLRDERFVLFENISEKLRNAAKGRPMVVVLDDLQWADSSTRELFFYIARTTVEDPILLLGIYRSEEIDEGSQDLLEKLTRDELVDILEIDRLDIKSVGKMLVDRYVQAPNDLVKAVFKKTEGNPFFVNEVLNTLEAAGKIDPQDPSTLEALDTKAIEAIPQSVKDVIIRRIRGLSRDNYNFLEWMAAIGNDVPPDLLYSILKEKMAVQQDKEVIQERIKDIMAQDPEGAPGKIAALMEQCSEFNEIAMSNMVKDLKDMHLIKEAGNYKFHNILIQEVVYKRIPSHARAQMHLFIGEEMEKVYGADPEEVAEKLANQFVRAREREKGYIYSVMAGDKAARFYALDEALSHFENAVWMFDEPERRLPVIQRILEVSEGLSWPASIEYGEEFIKNQVDDLISMSRAYRTVGFMKAEINSEQVLGLKYLNKALEYGKGSRNEKLKNMRVKAEILRRLGDYELARHFYQECVNISSETEIEGARARVGLGTLLMYIGEYEGSAMYLENAVIVLQSSGQLETLPMAFNNLGVTYKDMGEFDKAAAAFERSVEAGRRVFHDFAVLYALSNLSDLYAKKFRKTDDPQDIKNCLQYAKRTHALAGRIGHVKMVAVADGLFGLAYGYSKEIAKAEEAFDKSLRYLKNYDEFSLYADILHDRAMVYKFNDDRENWRLDLLESIKVFKKIGADKRVEELEDELIEL